MTAGIALRVPAQLAYQPALLYIDTMKYLYNAYPGADPVGYKAPLKAILAVGDLSTVTAVQHLLGLAMAGTIYLILIAQRHTALARRPSPPRRSCSTPTRSRSSRTSCPTSGSRP